jgi:hypothetical protein
MRAKLASRLTRFSPEGDGAFVAWLNENPAGSKPPVTRYMLGLHELRRDLQRKFLDPTGIDAEEFRDWFIIKHGPHFGFDHPLVAATAGPTWRPPIAREIVVEIVTASDDQSDAVHLLARGLRTAGLPHRISQLGTDGTATAERQDREIVITIFAMAPAELSAALQRTRESGRVLYSIALIASGAVALPKDEQLNAFDELWVSPPAPAKSEEAARAVVFVCDLRVPAAILAIPFGVALKRSSRDHRLHSRAKLALLSVLRPFTISSFAVPHSSVRSCGAVSARSSGVQKKLLRSSPAQIRPCPPLPKPSRKISSESSAPLRSGESRSGLASRDCRYRMPPSRAPGGSILPARSRVNFVPPSRCSKLLMCRRRQRSKALAALGSMQGTTRALLRWMAGGWFRARPEGREDLRSRLADQLRESSPTFHAAGRTRTCTGAF